MVYFGKPYDSTTFNTIISWVQKSGGCGVVSSSDSLLDYGFGLWSIDNPYRPKATVSIVICTLDREDSLNETLQSLSQQTFKDFEVVLITEKGNLSELRQKGLESATGRIVTFIDDDVYCPPTWLQGITQSFREGILGVTGPTIITKEYQQNRDCLRFKKLRKLQEWLFKVPTKPGHLSPCGAPSMASNFRECNYEGEVEYLECCNMSVSRKEALDVGGFDPIYIQTSEWCEPDLSLRLGRKGRLYYTPLAKLYHRPSRAGVYKARNKTEHRWRNFICFQRRWIRNGIRTSIYRCFIYTYFRLKDHGLF